MLSGRHIWRTLLRVSRIQNASMSFSKFATIGGIQLGLLAIHCEKFAEMKEIYKEDLSHDECIKQACVVSANAASTLLTTATSAVLDVSMKYKKSLSRILGLYEELLLTRGENSKTWETAVEYRGELNKMKSALLEMNSYMSSVEKVVNSTTEAAFLAGAEYLCTILCERLYSAQAEITRNISEIKKLEDDFLKLEEEVARTVKRKEVKQKS